MVKSYLIFISVHWKAMWQVVVMDMRLLYMRSLVDGFNQIVGRSVCSPLEAVDKDRVFLIAQRFTKKQEIFHRYLRNTRLFSGKISYETLHKIGFSVLWTERVLIHIDACLPIRFIAPKFLSNVDRHFPESQLLSRETRCDSSPRKWRNLPLRGIQERSFVIHSHKHKHRTRKHVQNQRTLDNKAIGVVLLCWVLPSRWSKFVQARLHWENTSNWLCFFCDTNVDNHLYELIHLL